MKKSKADRIVESLINENSIASIYTGATSITEGTRSISIAADAFHTKLSNSTWDLTKLINELAGAKSDNKSDQKFVQTASSLILQAGSIKVDVDSILNTRIPQLINGIKELSRL